MTNHIIPHKAATVTSVCKQIPLHSHLPKSEALHGTAHHRKVMALIPPYCHGGGSSPEPEEVWPLSTEPSDSFHVLGSVKFEPLHNHYSKLLSLRCSVRTGHRSSTCTQSGSLIPHVGTTPKVYSGPKTTRKKNCARLRIFALGLRIFCARLRFSFSPKWPKSARKCSEMSSELGVRIRCPKVSELGARIGCLIGTVLKKCQHHACLALANEHSRSPTIYYCAPKVVFGSHMVVDHVSGKCGFAIFGMIFEEF